MGKKEIVIVEDNDDIRDIIGHVLKADSYRLEMCATVSAFSTKIQERLPDVVVLDIMLPDGDGIDLCRQLKSNPETKHIPVLLMSAHKKESIKEADAFIHKPFDIGFFKSTVESFL